MMVLSAVSTPIASVVPQMSLSIDAGIPMTGIEYADARRCTPVRVPFPLLR